METLKSGDAPALVTNIEVLEIVSKKLNERAEEENDESTDNPRQRRKMEAQLRHRDWIEERMYEYLKSTPCGSVDIMQMPNLVSDLKGKQNVRPSNAPQRREVSEHNHADGVNGVDDGKPRAATTTEDGASTEAGESDEGFGLTDAETLQILNMMPQESVEIHLLVEDLPSRLSEERQEELLGVIGKYAAPKEENDAEDENANYEEGMGEEVEGENGAGKYGANGHGNGAEEYYQINGDKR